MTDNVNDRACETCDYCVYLGEGDFACDERDYELVIEDWIPLRDLARSGRRGEMTDNRTTELREKLDELGIEHFDYDKGGRTQTMWQGSDGFRHFTYETAANPAKTARLVIEWFPTPDQAIAATLGSGTCELKHASWDDGQCTWGCICSACDARFEHETGIGYNYCPNCGAKVIQGVDNAD